jgi:hypothetical protein
MPSNRGTRHNYRGTGTQQVALGPTRRTNVGPGSNAPIPISMGPTRNLNAAKAAGSTQDKPIQAAAKAGPRMKPKTKIGLGIAGAAAIGVVMNRRGQGSSSGRQSTSRY